MSGATYRIDVEHRPDPQSAFPWIARIIRLSDEKQLGSVWGKSDHDAITKARKWLDAQNVKQPGRTLYVNDDGTDAQPHSPVPA